MGRMAEILSEEGAAIPILAEAQCQAWLHRLLAEYIEAHEYLDRFVPFSDDLGNKIPLRERIKVLREMAR